MPDFGFFSWPEPGVSSYLEVRQQTLDREREIAMGLHQLARRTLQQSAKERKNVTGDDDTVSEESTLTIGPDSWSKKIPKLIWRGVPMVEVRHVSSIFVMELEHRDLMLLGRQELLRASEGQSWSDVQSLDWGKVNDEDKKEKGGDLKSMPEHCDYRYLMQTEGELGVRPVPQSTYLAECHLQVGDTRAA